MNGASATGWCTDFKGTAGMVRDSGGSDSSSDESEVEPKAQLKRAREDESSSKPSKSTKKDDGSDSDSDEAVADDSSSDAMSEDGEKATSDDSASDSSEDDDEDDEEEEEAEKKKNGKKKEVKQEETARKQAAARVRQGLSVVPVVQAAGEELAQMLKKLNSNDSDEQLEAITLFEERARSAIKKSDVGGGDGADLIHAYFQSSPECQELFRVLAKGAAGGDKVRDSGKMNALMRLLQAILACHVVPLLLEHSRNLGTKIIRKANKAFIGAITSGKTRLFVETMRVICRASELGVVQARDAWKKFSPYMKNMARHFEVMKQEDKSNKEGPRIERPFARDARSVVVEWGIVLLRVGDPQLIAPVLGTATFLPAAIKNIASDPPELVDKLLQVIARMSVRVCMLARACTHARTARVRTHTHTHKCTHLTCTHTRTHTHTHTHTRKYTHTQTRTHTHTHTQAYTYTHANAHIYTPTHTTRTHTLQLILPSC